LFKVFHLHVAKVDLDVAYVFKCFRHFRPLFQVFYLDVAKVNLHVAYVAMTKYACCKPSTCSFQTASEKTGHRRRKHHCTTANTAPQTSTSLYLLHLHFTLSRAGREPGSQRKSSFVLLLQQCVCPPRNTPSCKRDTGGMGHWAGGADPLRRGSRSCRSARLGVVKAVKDSRHRPHVRQPRCEVEA
jgi:hypothetical protein